MELLKIFTFKKLTISCYEYRALIYLDELYAHVIPAHEGIQTDQSSGSCFRSTDRRGWSNYATFLYPVLPLAIGTLEYRGYTVKMNVA